MAEPRVSVVLPMFNGAAYVGEAVASVLRQTFGDFELIVIDDGSTDGSAEVVRAEARRDRRLRLVERGNRGLVATLNEGMGMARGELIARMDADDVSLPERFVKQVAYLDGAPAVAVVGAWAETFGGAEAMTLRYPTAPEAVDASLVFRSSLAHPSVMMRRGLFADNVLFYDSAARHVEDYALWVTIAARKKGALANIPEVLFRYRTHANQVSVLHIEEQQRAAVTLQLGFIRDRLKIDESMANASVHGALAFSHFERNAAFVTGADAWLRQLAFANEKWGAFERAAFLRVLTGRFVAVHRFAQEHGLAPPEVSRSPFERFIEHGALSK